MRATFPQCHSFIFSCEGFCLRCFFGIKVFILTLKPEADAALQGSVDLLRLFMWDWEAQGGQFCASTDQWL